MDLDRINELGFEKGSRWKSFIFIVSFSLWWNFFIAVQCYLVFLLVTFNLAFISINSEVTILRYVLDFIYLVDIICTMRYKRNPKLRSFKYTKVRHWFFLFLDVLSVIPLELAYTFHYYSSYKEKMLVVSLIQNRTLRIYRVFQLEYFYGITVRKTNEYALFMFLQFTSKAILIAHILTCVWANMEKSVSCDESSFNCFVWYETNMAILIILNWSGKFDMFRKPWERVLVSIGIFLGFLLIFTYFYPKSLHVVMEINYKRIQYYDKYRKLQLFLKNMASSQELRDSILYNFNEDWQKDRMEFNVHKLLQNIPVALKKEIFTDIYWEAFRHSELLRDVSRSCKRSLSLAMSTTQYQAGEKIYYKGDNKLGMMFLVQGTVQIMAEENEEAPVLSFSSGTVFGELSLFLYCQSQAIVKCKSYCELQILRMHDASCVIKDYPKDKKLILHNLNQRLKLARYSQWRKLKFCVEKRIDVLDTGLSAPTMLQDCVKWIKTQWRALLEEHQRHRMVQKAKQEGVRLPSWQRFTKPEIKIEFITNYLDLIVLSDMLEEKKDVVCLRTTFPWSIDPSAQFLKIWYYIIVFTAFIPSLLYPYCTAWVLIFPWPMYILSFLVTGLFQIDLAFKLFTAVKTKQSIITKFSAVLRQRLQEPTFYLDLLAALPYQIYIMLNINVHEAPAYLVGLILHPALLKSHVFITLRVPLSTNMDVITVLKNSLIFILLVYWFAEMIQLCGIRALLSEDDQAWIKRFLQTKTNKHLLEDYFVSVFRALVTAISIPDYSMYPDENNILVCFCIVKYLFLFFLTFFFADFYGVSTVKIYGQENFQLLLNRIIKFLHSTYISPQVTNRLLKIIKFQWYYNRADALTSDVSTENLIPTTLKKSIYSETVYKTIKTCRMFRDESIDLVTDIVERSVLVAIPPGSMVAKYGQREHYLAILHRGYCQVNSFLLTDISAGLSRNKIIGPGEVFPALSTFCDLPNSISVISITDCELVTTNLNDMMKVLIAHNFLKDVIDVIKEGKYLDILKFNAPAMIILDRKKTDPKILKEAYRNSYKKIIFGSFFYRCCPQKFVNLKIVKNWEVIYTVFLTFACIVWPCCFGLLIYYSYFVIPIIMSGKIIILVHIMFQFFTPYYNKKGLLITHPVYTCCNYFTTTFLLDFFCVFPVYPIYLYGFADPYKQPNFIMVVINFVQHYMKLIHIFGFMDNLERLLGSKYYVRMTKIILILLLTFNLLINLFMYICANWEFGGPYKVVGFKLKWENPRVPGIIAENSIIDYYQFVAYWILCNLTTTDYLMSESNGFMLGLSYLQSFIGTVLNFYLYAWISSTSIFANTVGTIYQEKIASFVKFLESEKADDKLIEYAITHFTHEWSQTEGENLKKVFEHLPVQIHQELLYPLYKPTICKNEVFANVDEGFYKALSLKISNVYFNRGSLITFQNEVMTNIYFVHKGKCFVYDWFLTLNIGSMVGDIKRTGLSLNRVYALTNVELLKISSDDFYNILESFYEIEPKFTQTTKNIENFIKIEGQVNHEIRSVDSRDVLNAFGLRSKEIGFEDESYFEDPENASIQLLKPWKAKQESKNRLFIIYPGTWKMKLFMTGFLAVTFSTLIVIPTLSSFGGLTIPAFIAVGVLDFLWLLVIVCNFRVGYVDKAKGDVITDVKVLAKRYVKKWDGFALDVLALMPFEVIPIILANGVSKANHAAVALLRLPRLLRAVYIARNIRQESRKLTSNTYLKILYVILNVIVFFFCLANIYIPITTEPSIVAARNPYKLETEQFFAFVLAFEYVVNFISSANVCVLIPTTISEISFFNIASMVTPYAKGWLISKILSILYVRDLANSFYKSQVISLESYLKGKDTSPSIIKEVLSYKFDLLVFTRSENMPTFLTTAPVSLRIKIMKDIYMQHLLECPLFKDINIIFLEQLIARMKREIYFPGQKIVERSDVDHRMYFIHSGEIYVINQTKDRAYIEYVVRKLYENDYFGEAQGLWFSLPHRHTYRARTLTQLIVLHADDWVDLRRSFPSVARDIFEKAKALRIF